MPPKTPQLSDHDLFRMRLEAMIDGRHELVRLARLIDWTRFDEAFGALYDENRGRPALPTRLMAGLHLLKHIKGLSDEQICAQWVENPYLQAFCGEEFFRHELPLDRSSMTRWRGRIGPEKLEVLLTETIAVAAKAGRYRRARWSGSPSTRRWRPRPWPTPPTATSCCARSSG